VRFAYWFRFAAFLLSIVVLTLEIPGRAIYERKFMESAPRWMFPGVDSEDIRGSLAFDFVAKDTRIAYDFDMFIGWRAKPGQQGKTYRLNSDGRRDDHDYTTLAPRVVFLTGGSAAWSLGASDNGHTIAAQLEKKLNAATRGARIEVVNLAEQAFGLRQEGLQVLDNIHLKPELVIFYDGVNDLHTIRMGRDPERFRTWANFEDILEAALLQTTNASFALTSRDLLEDSMSLRVARYLLRGFTGSFAPPPLEEPPLTPAQTAEIRRFFDRQIRHQHRVLEALGAKSMFVLQPIAYIGRPSNADGDFVRGGDWWRAAYAVLDPEYRRLAAADSVPAVSLTEALRNVPERLYIDPVHMNDSGYEAVSEALAAEALRLLEPERAAGRSASTRERRAN